MPKRMEKSEFASIIKSEREALAKTSKFLNEIVSLLDRSNDATHSCLTDVSAFLEGNDNLTKSLKRVRDAMRVRGATKCMDEAKAFRSGDF